jgi:hypothetical protein
MIRTLIAVAFVAAFSVGAAWAEGTITKDKVPQGCSPVTTPCDQAFTFP